MSWKDENSLICDTFSKRRYTPFHDEEWKRNIPSSYKTRCQLAYERCKALAKIGHPIPKDACNDYNTLANSIDAIIKRRNARAGIMPSLPKDLPIPKQRFNVRKSVAKRSHVHLASRKRSHVRLASRKRSPTKLASRKRSHVRLTSRKRSHVRLASRKRSHVRLAYHKCK